MSATWIERARWEWTGPHDYQHEVWINAYVDDQSHEIHSWGVHTRLGGIGKTPKSAHFPISLHSPEGARAKAYEIARAYREQFGDPAE